tara:strand:- start:605 stop:1174 length:570 start_codon:yes stop_codon:yes gene_type:complete
MSEVQVLKFEEAEPETYPDLILLDGNGVAEPAEKPDPHVWARLESYVCHRWTPRQCVWTCAGPGDWRPHLSPVSNIVIDQWDDATKTWTSVTAEPSPLGFYLPRSCVYRITGTLGEDGGQVPQCVVEAYRRLAAYMTEAQLSTVPAGASSFSQKMGDGWDETIERSPTFVAKAMQYSGAGDLLRGWRRV